MPESTALDGTGPETRRIAACKTRRQNDPPPVSPSLDSRIRTLRGYAQCQGVLFQFNYFILFVLLCFLKLKSFLFIRESVFFFLLSFRLFELRFFVFSSSCFIYRRFPRFPRFPRFRLSCFRRRFGWFFGFQEIVRFVLWLRRQTTLLRRQGSEIEFPRILTFIFLK